MIITIDYDLKNDFHDIIFYIRANYLCSNNSNCRIAKTRKGYHIYLFLNTTSLDDELFFRNYLIDDVYRLDYDLNRYGFGYRLGNVAYSYKTDIYEKRDIMKEQRVSKVDINITIPFLLKVEKKVAKKKKRGRVRQRL